MLLRQSDSLKTYNRKSFIPSYRLTVTYTEIVYPARILPNQTAKPVPETQKLAECIYDCRTLLQQILTDGLTVLQNSKNPTNNTKLDSVRLSHPIFFFTFFFTFSSSSLLSDTYWYFVTKIVLTYCEKKCSSDQKKLLKFKAEANNLQTF